MKRAICAAALLLVAACGSKYESAAMGLSWEPPSGVKFVSEQAGPPVMASFSPGIEVRSVATALPEITDLNLRPVLEQACTAAGVPVPARVDSMRMGSIPAGPVARYTFRTGADRGLLYVVAAKDRFVLMILTASESAYPRQESAFERSLARMHLRAARL